MKKSRLYGAVCAFFFSLVSIPSHAELIDNGDGLLYDTVLDITWAQPDGQRNWDDANTWASELTLGGVSGWRLPYISVAAGAGPLALTPGAVDCSTASEVDCQDNELGYMFYHNLGGTFGEPIPPNGDPDVLALFPTLQAESYWSGTESISGSAWFFGFAAGAQASDTDDRNFYSWAVHDGNVGLPSGPVDLAPAMVDCFGLGPAFCAPPDPLLFPGTTPFVVFEGGDIQNDPLYTITASEANTAIDLTMDELVAGANFDGGFRLVGLITSPPESFIAPIEAGDIEFLGDWASLPNSIPVVTGPPSGQTLEWSSLAGADPIAEAIIRINLPFVGGLPSDPVDLSGSVEDAGGTPLCSLVLASGQFDFSCNPNGPYSLLDLATETDGTVKRQVYADGFFPNVETLQGSVDETVTLTRVSSVTGACPDYNTPYEPGVFPDSAGKRIDISGTVLLQDTQTPICALALANGQFGFTCDGTGSYAANIPLDENGQFKLQVYADGFVPSIQVFDEFQTVNDVRMARAVECQ